MSRGRMTAARAMIPRPAYSAAATDTTIMTMNMISQLVRLWLTFHQMMVNRIAQMNTTMSRQLPR